MAFNFNGNTPKKILYNGLNVAKLVYNNVVVWMQKYLATNEELNQAKIYGISTQNGTPTPTVPVDIECNNGVIKYSPNICNVNSQTALVGYYISSSGIVTADIYNWIYKDFIPVKPNTTYTLTMSTPVYYVSISEYSTASDSGFVIRKAGSTGSNTTLTITTGANTNYVRFGTNVDRTAVTLEEVLAINWMLNIGNTMTYQPYVEGGIYTDGTVETINVHGKNLFDETTVTLGYYYTDGGTWTINSYSYTSAPIYMGADTTVTFSRSYSARGVYLRIHAFNSNNEWIGLVAKSDTTSSLSVTGTTPTNTAYIRVCGAKNNDTLDSDIQVEYGPTATDYKPYFNGGSATAEMLLSVGDYKDIQSVIDGAVTRKVGVKVLDGTENWIAYTSSTLVIENATSAWGAVAGVGGYCTHLTVLKAGETTFAGSCRFATAFNLYEYKTAFGVADVAGFKAKLADQYNAGTPVIVIYPLAEETTESVTSQTLTAQEGTNIISSNKGAREMEVKYYRT